MTLAVTHLGGGPLGGLSQISISALPPDPKALKKALRALATAANMPKIDPGEVTSPVMNMKTVAGTLYATQYISVLKTVVPSELVNAVSAIAPYYDTIMTWVEKILATPLGGQIPVLGDVASAIENIVGTIEDVVNAGSGSIAWAINAWLAVHNGGSPPPPPSGGQPVVTGGGGVTIVTGVKFNPAATGVAYPPGTIATTAPGGGYRVAVPKVGK